MSCLKGRQQDYNLQYMFHREEGKVYNLSLNRSFRARKYYISHLSYAQMCTYCSTKVSKQKNLKLLGISLISVTLLVAAW